MIDNEPPVLDITSTQQNHPANEENGTPPQAEQAAVASPRYIVVDTEGTGLFDYKQPADAPGQPRLAEIVMIFIDADLQVEREYHAYIKPDGWEMTPGATAVNGLTTEFLLANGVPIAEALAVYNEAIAEGRVMVAHNQQHDGKQVRAELRRAEMPDQFESAPGICTMRLLTAVCKIPPNGGRGSYKWPKLSEACVFFGLTEMGDHSAINDAKACLALLRKIRDLGLMPEGRVHYAKNRPE